MNAHGEQRDLFVIVRVHQVRREVLAAAAL
jgi:hypothetical protein